MTAGDKDGHKHQLGDGNWKITNGSLLVARGEHCYILYKAQVKACDR